MVIETGTINYYDSMNSGSVHIALGDTGIRKRQYFKMQQHFVGLGREVVRIWGQPAWYAVAMSRYGIFLSAI